jgi:hypothetical protein
MTVSPEREHRLVRQRVWHQGLLILLTIVGLSVSLATRVWHVVPVHGVSVQASVSQGMRQHMDRDAAHWVSPVSRFAFLHVTTFYPKFAPAGPPLPAALFDKSLYNRPPPALSIRG